MPVAPRRKALIIESPAPTRAGHPLKDLTHYPHLGAARNPYTHTGV
jgi:hypothetical protein